MPPATARRDLVLAVGPFEEPNGPLAVAAHRAGALGVVDLGRDRARALAALAEVSRRPERSFGVRVPPGCPLAPGDLPEAADVVVLAHGSPWPVAAAGPGRRVLVEVVSPEEARAAAAAGAHGLIAVGHEAGGRIGDLTTFVLLQHLVADAGLRLPVWARGGIGPHTAAAAVAGGAAGIVLDTQLALLAESAPCLPDPVAAALRSMDGGETAVLEGHRVYSRPDLPLHRLADAAAAIGGVGSVLGARGLDRQLLPVGQDGALARRFAERYGTTGRAVRAVRSAVTASLAAAVRHRPLMPGTDRELPVVQGPMTRVSDRAAFADEVAAGGGLPFLALALMDGSSTRQLLEETAARLGDRRWGVGLLGFAPPELRDEQLAEVAAVKPPYALIAGGRPDQAAPLEAAGIRTYLHVPSPGLLDQFLRAGARRFVFEGLECGGHVGPRASFPLWEAQVDLLLAHARRTGRASDLDVLFAGGIHDARSAAMAAAAAAPLAELGARIGVLMGTAYLFTEEAVAAGAILPGFQQAAVDCRATELLQTAPGHATRCAGTPFVSAFAEARADLEARGVPHREMWAQLEELNLGRLRIASKGVVRDGAALVQVDEETQHREGMFMLGQVAALRGAPTTVAELHGEVTEGATAYLAARAQVLGIVEEEPVAEAEPLDVAIVGMACVLPGAADLEAFWRNVVTGADAVTEVPRERWDHDKYFDPAAVKDPLGKTPSKWGGFVPPIPFDAPAYGIPPASLASIEPAQLLALHVASRALDDAGYGDGREFDRGRTSVIFGAEAGTDLAGAYGFRSLYPAYFGDLPADLDAQLPKPTEDSFPGVLANVIAGRIANRLDLGGVNYTVDAACAASLAALDLACKELVQGSSDVVLCGGVDTHNGINDFLMFSSVHALSPSGRCATFDSAADGIALGEGAACLVLKRLEDAERDGDRVYAVVKGVGGSSDGRSLGLTAPRPEGQRRALERAYARAGVSPAQIGLVEAHGTGTVVGDRAELETLTEVFTAHGAAAGGCALGSVKSQIGHTKCAAGLAGLIKATLALHHGVRPPTLHVREPNAAWDPGTSPFFFDGQARPWAEEDPALRRAGVSAFGFGGTNFHAVLAGHAAPVRECEADVLGSAALAEWPAELFCFAGEDHTEAVRALDKLAALLDDRAPRTLRGLAALAAETVAAAAGAPVQVALVAADLEDLRVKLARARDGVDDPAGEVFHRRPAGAGADRAAPGQVAFLYPGQGSQRPGMLADLFVAFPGLRDVLGEALPATVEAMFPPAAFTAADREAAHTRITDTRTAQPALGVAEVAMTRLLAKLGVRPDLAAGHSYGELAALWAAGAYDSATLLRLSSARAAAILGAAGTDPGAMAAVAAPAERLGPLLTLLNLNNNLMPGSNGSGPRGGVVAANLNTPAQTVISGPTPALEAAVAALEAEGIQARRLPVACAFHSAVVAGASGELARVLADLPVDAPQFPVWSNGTAAAYPRDAEAVRGLLARQVAEPVRFVEQIEAMYAAGARVFVEAGPGRALTGMVRAILGDRPHTAVACDVPGESGLRRLLAALAELAVAGVPVAVGELTRGRFGSADTQPAKLPAWQVDGHLVRMADGTPVAGGLRPAEPVRPPVVVQAAGGGTAAAATAPDPRETAVLQYLAGARELVAAQRDVLLGFLGTGPAPQYVPAPAVPAAAYSAQQAPAPAAQTAAAAPAAADRQAAAAQAEPVAAVVELLDAERALDAVLDVIGTRTGYPRDMLDTGLDLEADLSIDSIKRTEIIGELAMRLDMLDEALVERLARVKTISAIVEGLVEHAAGRAGGGEATESAPAADGSSEAGGSGAVMEAAEAASGWFARPGGADETAPTPDPDDASAVGRGAVAGSAAASAAAADAGAVSADEPDSRSRWFERGAGAGPDAGAGAPADPGASAGVGVGAGVGAAAERAVFGGITASGSAAAQPDGVPLRHVVDLVEYTVAPYTAEQIARAVYAKSVVLIADAHGIALALADLLERHGASVRIAEPGQALPDAQADALVHLGALRPDELPVLLDDFGLIRDALTGGARHLVLATGCGGAFGRDPGQTAEGAYAGIGLAGFGRTAAHEYPDTVVRVVDVDPKEEPGAIAAQLLGMLAEVPGDGSPVVVGLGSAVPAAPGAPLVRRALDVRVTEMPAAAPVPGLGRDSVVLLTGGARGITARIAVGLAAAYGCHIELVGRTADTGPEDPAIAAVTDKAALRAALIAAGLRKPAAIEAEIAQVLARREVRATLDALGRHAASVRIHAADVRDAAAVRDVVADVYARHGRLDGIVHGAGMLDDRLLKDKSEESFAQVFTTKVVGAQALADAVLGRPVPARPGFMVLFGSVAGVFGNRGQADYAAANDALDTLAHLWRHAPGAESPADRVLGLDWGPWAAAGGGMVTAELERHYERLGMPLIAPDAGVAAMLAELGSGTGAQAVYLCPPRTAAAADAGDAAPAPEAGR
ncbi:type I polyketide synthase [Yinghuangia soli]|uniref:SDR family NAD(P)-dependent oxidoreductase n=1 Tax=Yinghuangia soli TaxID=2908204 RepID=A0AA41U1N3_9ACTN|nr:type I polyketide synthase [Yinghuangia soli]MCF2530953.1 SDR family NAD(P)-dependent oxidoreductase [Yinghuangia soli]